MRRLCEAHCKRAIKLSNFGWDSKLSDVSTEICAYLSSWKLVYSTDIKKNTFEIFLCSLFCLCLSWLAVYSSFVASYSMPLAILKQILCFVDRASMYNLVNKANLVHNLFLVYISISDIYILIIIIIRRRRMYKNNNNL